MNRQKQTRSTGVHESMAVTGNTGGAEPIYGGLRERWDFNNWYQCNENRLISDDLLRACVDDSLPADEFRVMDAGGRWRRFRLTNDGVDEVAPPSGEA